MDIKLKEYETIDELECNDLKIIQNQNTFKFGIDAVLLADFSKEIRKNTTVVDLGTGTGVIPILLSAKTQAKKLIGVEIQEKACDMARRSVNLNNLQDKIEILQYDLKELTNILPKNEIDAIVTNPPYQKVNTGLIGDQEEINIARHEIKCTIEDICSVSGKLLKNNGELYMVHRPERLADIIYNMKINNLEPKKLRFIHPNSKDKANLMLIKAVKNAQPFLHILRPLIVYENGKYTDEILKIYNKK